jgi:hypothetical protein
MVTVAHNLRLSRISQGSPACSIDDVTERRVLENNAGVLAPWSAEIHVAFKAVSRGGLDLDQLCQ